MGVYCQFNSVVMLILSILLIKVFLIIFLPQSAYTMTAKTVLGNEFQQR